MAPAPIVDRVCPVELVSLCPQMDIIAVVSNDGLLVNRTTSWQRLMAPTDVGSEGSRITALCWSPDGKHLATGHANGALRVLEVEQQDLENETTRDEALGGVGALSTLRLGAEVVSMTWSIALHTTKPPSEDPWEMCRITGLQLGAAYLERSSAFIPLPADSPVAEGRLGRSRPEEDEEDEDYPPPRPPLDVDEISLLASLDAAGRVLLSLDGQFAVSLVDVSRFFPTTSSSSSSSSSSSPPQKKAPAFTDPKDAAKGACLSANLARFVTWGHDPSEPGGILSALDIGTISYARRELVPCAKQYSGCSALLETSREALSVARQRYASVLDTLDSKFFTPYAAALRREDDDREDYANVAAQLMTSITHGLASTGRVEVLVESILPSEAEIVKLHKNLDATLVTAMEAFDERLVRATRHLVFRASELEALARCGDVLGYDRVGLSQPECLRFCNSCEQFALKAEECVEGIRCCRRRLADLCNWLADLAMMAAARKRWERGGEDNNDDDKRPPLAAITPQTPAHAQDDLCDLFCAALDDPPPRPSLSISERLLFGSYSLSRALCDPDPAALHNYDDDDEEEDVLRESEARFLLGCTSKEDAPKRDAPASRPSPHDADLSLCGRLRECCELGDAVFDRIRDAFSRRNRLKTSYRILFPEVPIDVALRARIRSDDDAGDCVICAVATNPRTVWLLDLTPSGALAARRLALDASLLRLDLYGAQAGYRTKHAEKLILMVRSSSTTTTTTNVDHLWLLDDDKLFQGKPPLLLADPPDNSPPPPALAGPAGLVVSGGADDVVMLDDDDDEESAAVGPIPIPLVDPEEEDDDAPRDGCDFHHTSSSSSSKVVRLSASSEFDEDGVFRTLQLHHPRSTNLFVSGCRGVAAVAAAPNILTLYDVEDLDDDDDDEEEDGDEELP
ncbi:hypothetical protein CTAYLR_006290 [Chrysophaeum taylorii]|uniref:Anaphase-promoting complex subunit 4 n=1 Tax=Chrysophaeum taylorii TaxID=2483200 RepID=A0AAD7UJT0_9STRA|nr:hypothetical protein CTAYLR_006290 [Chrysophaeum taylorii]